MKKKIYLLVISTVVIYCSCVSSFKTGIYSARYGNGNPNNFTFFEDSTFLYNYYGSIKKHSSGKYIIKNGKIILNSYIKDIVAPVKVSILSLDSLKRENRITFQFKLSEEDQKNYKCTPILNKDTLNNKEGIIYLTQGIQINDEWGTYTMYYKEPLDSVKLYIFKNPFISRPTESLTTETMHFNKVVGQGITFNLVINDSLFGYRIFDNTILDMKRKKIVFIDMEENDNANTLYLRQE